jgi:hypothetical protein
MVAQSRPYKVADGAGLTLLVQPTGAKWWRFRYRINGKEKMLSLGTFPTVSLDRARILRDDAGKLVSRGIDPSIVRAASPRHRALATGNPARKQGSTESLGARRRTTIGSVASAWLGDRTQEVSKDVLRRDHWVLRNYVLPQLGRRSFRSLRQNDIRSLMACTDWSTHPEIARRVRQVTKQVIRYAVSSNQLEYQVAKTLYQFFTARSRRGGGSPPTWID